MVPSEVSTCTPTGQLAGQATWTKSLSAWIVNKFMTRKAERVSLFAQKSLVELWPGPINGPLTAICDQADCWRVIRQNSIRLQHLKRNQDYYATFPQPKTEIVCCSTYAIVQRRKVSKLGGRIIGLGVDQRCGLDPVAASPPRQFLPRPPIFSKCHSMVLRKFNCY